MIIFCWFSISRSPTGTVLYGWHPKQMSIRWICICFLLNGHLRNLFGGYNLFSPLAVRYFLSNFIKQSACQIGSWDEEVFSITISTLSYHTYIHTHTARHPTPLDNHAQITCAARKKKQGNFRKGTNVRSFTEYVSGIACFEQTTYLNSLFVGTIWLHMITPMLHQAQVIWPLRNKTSNPSSAYGYLQRTSSARSKACKML